MNALAARIEKEARPLIWVWGALVLFGIIALAPAGSFTMTLLRLRPIACWIGITLLAALSFGHEFQHGTVSLLLAQPMDRMKVWREKWIVLLPAVATVAYVNLLYTTDSLFWPDWQTPLIAIVWIAIAVCTSTFWSLVGRSTINGFVLNILQGFGIFMAWHLAGSFRISGSEPRPALPWLVVVASVGYSFLMLWLGRRKFARFEVTGASSSSDLLTVGSPATRGHFAGLFRCLATQPILNLIRKELRLLWLVWLLILASILGVLCLAVFRFVPGIAIDKLIFTTEIFIVALASLSAILAGSLSMGEERRLGTQSSNRMLPVSATVQWLLKLTVILLVSCLGLVLPVVVAQAAFARDFIGLFEAPFFLIAVPPLLSVAAFFCASAVKDTARAALLVVPAIGVVFLASEAVNELIKAGILDAVIWRLHPLPFRRESSMLLFQLRTDRVLIALALPPLLIQSYRLFRMEIKESVRSVVSSLLWVVLLASVFVTVSRMPMAVEQRAHVNLMRTIGEMREATAQLPTGLVPPGTNSRQLSLEELSKVAHLSETARALLRDAAISVKRGRIYIPSDSGYTTIIRFRNGRIFGTDGYGVTGDFPGS